MAEVLKQLGGSEDLGLLQLAATHAALDPARRQQRSDVLMSAGVSLLATAGDLTTAQLCSALRKMWRTEAITEPLVEEALNTARASGLVARVTTLDDRELWQATPSARQEVQEDSKWVEAVVHRLEDELRARLEQNEVRFKPERLPKLAKQLIEALAHGAEGVYQLDHVPGDPSVLRPIEFRADQVREYLRRHVQPKPVAAILVQVVDEAMDPDDDFGNEVVHLLVMSGLLQAFLGKRDLGVRPDLTGTRVLLDTSTLVNLVDGPEGVGLVESLIHLSLSLGVEVIVADHTIDEWMRVWEAAEAEQPELVDNKAIPHLTDRLVGNPFVKGFLQMKARDEKLRWRTYMSNYHDIQTRLEGLGVVVRPAGNNTEQDRENASRVLELLLELSARDDVPGSRTRTGAEADAASCAMVMRWRGRSTPVPPGAYFVAQDYLTDRAHEALAGDDRVPIVIKPAAWLMYLAQLAADDPATRLELAELVGSVVVRNSVLGLATSFTVEDAVELSRALAEDDRISSEDLHELVQLDLLSLIERGEEQNISPSAVVANEVLRKRSARRDARAYRAQTRAEADQVKSVETVRRVVAQSDEQRVNYERALDGKAKEIGSLEKNLDEANRERQDAREAAEAAQQSRKRLIRVLVVVVCGIALAASFLTALALDWYEPTARGWVVVGLAFVIYLVESVRYCWKLEVPGGEMLLALVGTVALTVIGIVATDGG